MSYDAGSRKQIRAKEKASALAESNRIAYTRQIMSDSPGREWMHGILLGCYIFSEPFVRGAADATAHNLGRQAVGKQIFADIINHCPREYVLMMQEQQAKETVNDRRDSDHRAASGEQPGSEEPRRESEGAPDDFGAEIPGPEE